VIFNRIRETVDNLESEALDIVNRGFNELNNLSDGTESMLAKVKINSFFLIEDL